MSFEMIKENYNKGYWTKVMVQLAVKKGAISAEQYQEITGEVYPAPAA